MANPYCLGTGNFKHPSGMRPVAGLAKESQQQYIKNIMLSQMNQNCATGPTRSETDTVSTESLIIVNFMKHRVIYISGILWTVHRDIFV